VFVNLGALHAFASGLGVHRVLASAAAVEVSILSNFLLNDAWTFRDRNATAAVTARGRFFRYHLVSLVGMAVQLAVFESANQGVMVALGRADPGAFIYPAQLLGIAAATAWNFVSNLRWTWAQARDPEDA
jgi:putative flippase GtrA